MRGTAYLPKDKPGPAPVIVLVHGNHTQCDSGTSPNCTAFKRNDLGYGYLGENLASWGYAVFSVDQDQMMAFQDGLARGMHQRRLLIAATLDALYKANQEPLPEGPNSNVGADLVGRLDFSRIGLMGHSRGGDAVTSFIDYNRSRPSPGRRYPAARGDLARRHRLRAARTVRRAVLAHLPLCDGDVSNLHAARNFERGQYIFPGDPFPRVQFAIHGTNHNWYNSVWDFDGEDSNTGDQACTITAPTTSPNHVRLSRGTYDSANRGSGDPARMGDQARIGLATMSSFFRRVRRRRGRLRAVHHRRDAGGRHHAGRPRQRLPAGRDDQRHVGWHAHPVRRADAHELLRAPASVGTCSTRTPTNR
ncbi:hypothetical protein GKE82_00030 [Conexibacter sp. W3-3-2]|uniref:hypothetical protein n=1 Tax=Conexibacter sp. W3-3-2 TaxID=2675227 RepID=UPI0012B8CEC6|nr:hypothetical protein [Conexibacter sp. W3-3-2]MTD42733.1 hypothetical protein [Conexibacter sp. W3-3-2]